MVGESRFHSWRYAQTLVYPAAIAVLQSTLRRAGEPAEGFARLQLAGVHPHTPRHSAIVYGHDNCHDGGIWAEDHEFIGVIAARPASQQALQRGAIALGLRSQEEQEQNEHFQDAARVPGFNCAANPAKDLA